MHLTSFLLPTLLVVTPGFARDCSHYQALYWVPCPNSICPGGNIDDYKQAFHESAMAYIKWADQDGTAGDCPSKCTKVKQSTMGKDYSGYTFIMYCASGRMHRVWSQGIPGYIKGIERKWDRRACDVSCTASGSQGCLFTVSTVPSVVSMFTG
ncbi:hypothetical protein Vi05172_g5953 [Venturia inaequalis]|nr:hypothetical protein Vi05172_g5953 [Venturia inaequalis]